MFVSKFPDRRRSVEVQFVDTERVFMIRVDTNSEISTRQTIAIHARPLVAARFLIRYGPMTVHAFAAAFSVNHFIAGVSLARAVANADAEIFLLPYSRRKFIIVDGEECTASGSAVERKNRCPQRLKKSRVPTAAKDDNNKHADANPKSKTPSGFGCLALGMARGRVDRRLSFGHSIPSGVIGFEEHTAIAGSDARAGTILF